MYRPICWAILVSLCIACPLLVSAQSGSNKESSSSAAQKSDQSGEKDKTGDSSAKESPKTDGSTESKDSPETAPLPPKKMDKGTYSVRLRDLEDRVNRLKEQIFRSKARLSLLAETVLDRKIAGAKAMIVFRNEMGGSFRLNKATFLLDGGPIFNKTDEGGNLAERKEIDLFNGPVMPGEHTLNAVLHYKGHGYGIFSYLKGYAFKTRSSHTFTVGEGKVLRLEIVGFEKGGVTTPLEERPAIRYIEELSDYDESEEKTQKKRE